MKKRIGALILSVAIGAVGFDSLANFAKGADNDMKTVYGDTAYSASGRSGEYIKDICDDWKFGGQNLSETEAAKSDYNDDAWDTFSIPHTWNARDAEDGGGNYLRTAYWYRKILDYDSDFTGKKVYMEFLGANQKTDLYVNGNHIPYNGTNEYTHKGGYTAFRYDITNYLTAGANTIAVRVDNTHDEEIAPISADFNMYGGIYRRVYLIVTNDVHVDLNNNGSSGLFLTTPNVQSKEKPANLGELNIKADIVNDSGEEKTVTVTATVDGENAPEPISEQITIPAKGKITFNKDTKVDNPHLWNGISYERNADNSDVGYMYTVNVEIKDGETVLDKVSDKVGFRYFYVDKDTGFYLNGKSHPLRGVNRHQFRAGKGSAMTEAEHNTDIEIMKDLGVNTIRLCHYPHTEYFYDLCDKNGIVLWTEIPFVNALGTSNNFADVTKGQLIELIRQQYNRPSICFWGLQNEVGNGNGDIRNPNLSMKQLIYELDELAHSEDNSGRYTVQAINRDHAMNQKGTANYADFSNNIGWKSDIAGWNIYPGWYNDKNFTGTFEEVMDRKASGDSRPMSLSEYGWGANVNQHELYPVLNKNNLTAGGKWHPEEYQSLMHEQAVDYINKHDYLWGTYVWAMFDFAVDSRNEGSQRALNDKGLVTGDRKIKKDSFYLYKANWNKADIFTHITSSRYAVRDNSETYIKVYSNCDSVELFVNGERQGEMASKGNGVFQTDSVPLSIGENTIKSVGKINGEEEEYTDVCVWSREVSESTNLASATLSVDNEKKTVVIDKSMTFSELKSELKGVNNASYTVFNGNSEITDDSAFILPGMQIRVTAEDSITTAVYSLVAANILSGKAVTATSNETGNIPENAVDGDSTTRWVAVDNKYPQSITVDLGHDYFMGDLTIDWDAKDKRYYTYDVEISEDGKTFTRVIDRNANTTAGSITDSLKMKKGRYIRINVYRCSKSAGYAAMYEMKLNGWNLSSDIYTIDHENRLIIVPAAGDGAGLTPAALDSNITVSGNCTYEIKVATGYVNDGNILEITDYEGRTFAYTICTKDTAKDKTTNLALFKDVYCSSEEGVSTTGTPTIAENINDGVLTSCWTAETNGGKEAKYPEWIGIDLGKEYKLSEIELYFETKADRVYSYQVYISSDTALSDGLSDIPDGYKLIIDKSGNTEKGGHYNLDCKIEKARYVAVKVTACDKWSDKTKYVASSIYEMAVYGRTIQTETPEPTDNPISTNTPEVTEKPDATNTPEPAGTPAPTDTPSPSWKIWVKSVTPTETSVQYELEAIEDISNYDLYTAIYNTDGILVGVKKNEISGTFDIDTAKGYVIKVMLWEKDCMKPIMIPAAVVDKTILE